jgi:GNAT superfamily N-acetyltransferase
MIEELSYSHDEQAKIGRDSGTSRVKTYENAAGTVLLRTYCSSSLVECLRVDEGLRAFARLPELEYQQLLAVARRSDSMLILAYTLTGEIVGQVTLAPADSWWQGLTDTYEAAVEVSTRWRGLGIARQLLGCAAELEALEWVIILGMGLAWHWDLRGLGLAPFSYRAMIERLFATYGFVEYLTSEENIRMDPANILLARLGSKVETRRVEEFFERLLQSDTLPGM